MRQYQLIRVGGLWHLTQQQARPPERAQLACYTSCGKWAEMKDGFQKGRPDCPTCVEHVSVFEQTGFTLELDTVEAPPVLEQAKPRVCLESEERYTLDDGSALLVRRRASRRRRA